MWLLEITVGIEDVLHVHVGGRDGGREGGREGGRKWKSVTCNDLSFQPGCSYQYHTSFDLIIPKSHPISITPVASKSYLVSP